MFSETLDTYACHVDGKPALISVDSRLNEKAPVLGLPFMAWISLDLRFPDAQGLAAEKERKDLEAMEAALIQTLSDARSAVYCGGCTTGGQQDYIFYLADALGWEVRVNTALAGFPEYSRQCSTHMETRWETYFSFLYPDEAEMDSLHAHALRRHIQRLGENPESPKLLRHTVLFPSPADLQAFYREAACEGFVAVEDPSAPVEGTVVNTVAMPCRVRISRADAPASVETVIHNLRELAEANGGRYEGPDIPV